MTTTEKAADQPMLKALRREASTVPPVWFMRQAGRYLPEYRELRSQAGSFLDLCYNSELAAEVTLQPIRRFHFDAAIIFADILLLPHALGQELRFATGEGPLLEPISNGNELSRLDASGIHDHLDPVYDALQRVSDELPDDVTLIGFCGAPWTVATYMIAGRGSPDQRVAREAMYSGEAWFGDLIDLLVETSIAYLSRQVEAGAQVLQVFDTWAGILSSEDYARWCIEPIARIAEGVRERYPEIPVIGFPRGSGANYLSFVDGTKVDGLGLDWAVPLDWARDELGSKVTLQGNLDPIVLLAGGDALDRAVDHILETLDGTAYVFNLGHGILPETPIAHVERVLDRVRKSAP